MKHELKPLPFARDALEPAISRETVEYHYDKHHRGYVDKLNHLLQTDPAAREFKDASLEEIIRRASGPLFNNAAQNWNHTFFWNCLSPKRSTPSSELRKLIQESFGSEEHFHQQFAQKAADLFGSGWAWLIRNSAGKLEILTTPDAMNPIRLGSHPILTCDVWEHAYYIDYRNDRAKFLNAFFPILNWEFASKQLASGESYQVAA